MARPRSTARPVTKAVFDPPSGNGPMPLALRDLIESEDPAIPAITVRVLTAKLAGRDVTDAEVLDALISAGRADHLAAALGGAA